MREITQLQGFGLESQSEGPKNTRVALEVEVSPLCMTDEADEDEDEEGWDGHVAIVIASMI